MAFNWTCPHCSMTQSVVDAQVAHPTSGLIISGQAEGSIGLGAMATGCANPECLRTTVDVTIGHVGYAASKGGYFLTGEGIVFSQRLLPQGSSRPQSDYIPQALRDDYYEACLIRDLSPKASATLIRRCLQGMIRDFASISKATLFAEITALRAAIDDGSADRAITVESVDAIDQVRGIGNIGAHMEKDINLIVEVEPGEAQTIIELVEMLFDEWYVARHVRQQRLKRIAKIATAKKEDQQSLRRIEGQSGEQGLGS